MGRLSALILSLFAIGIGTVVLAWLTFVIGEKALVAYRRLRGTARNYKP